jgi:acyl-CoA hydrolase
VSDWRERYAHLLATPAEAIRRIEPGRRIFIGSGAAEPGALVEALISDGEHLLDNEIVHILTLGPAPYVAPELAARFRHKPSSSVRTCARQCRLVAPTSYPYSFPSSPA